MVETRSMRKATAAATAATAATATTSKKKKTPTVTASKSVSRDECGKLNMLWAKCHAADRASKPLRSVQSGSVLYNRFIQKLLKSCKPYNGRKVFIVHKNGSHNFVCPDYVMRVGHYDLSISLVSNGYIYIHFLQDFFPNSNACVYTGDHITIAPTGKTHIHFHITNITYQMNNGYITYASSYNTSFCSLNIKDVTNVFSNSSITTKDKKEWLSHAACVNEYNVSFNKTPVDILDYDMDTFDIIFRLFLRGFSA